MVELRTVQNQRHLASQLKYLTRNNNVDGVVKWKSGRITDWERERESEIVSFCVNRPEVN